MFMMITFPWPIPSANVALTRLAGYSVPAADQQLDDHDLVGLGSGIHRLNNFRSRFGPAA